MRGNNTSTILFTVLGLLLLTCRVLPQTGLTFGVSGAASFTDISAAFRPLQGIPAPTNALVFSDDAARGLFSDPRFMFAAFGHAALIEQDHLAVHAGIRVSAFVMAPQFLAPQTVPISPDGTIYLATLGHRLQSAFTVAQFEPYLRVALGSTIFTDVGFPLMVPFGGEYTQSMQFIDPEGLPFGDGTTVQRTAQGTLNALAAAPGVSVRVGARLPLNTGGRLFVEPYVSYQTTLASLNRETNWRAVTLGGGVGVSYTFSRTTSDTVPDTVAAVTPDVVPMITPPTPQQPLVRRDTVFSRDTVVVLSGQVTDTTTTLVSSSADSTVTADAVHYRIANVYRTLVPRPPALLRATVKVAFMQPDGTVTDDVRLIGKRIRLTRKVPVVPVVVFDRADTAIPARYVQLGKAAARSWKESEALADEGIHWHYHVLNVIGARMRKQTGSTVRLQATTEARAHAVRKYLVETFGIAAERCRVELTQDDFNPRYDDVYIVASDPALMKPLVRTDVRTEGTLPRVRLTPEVLADAGLERWTIHADYAGREVRRWTDSSGGTAALTWNMASDLDARDVEMATVLVGITARDRTGAMVEGSPARISSQGAATIASDGVPEVRQETLTLDMPAGLAAQQSHVPVPTAATCITLHGIPVGLTWIVAGIQEPELHLYTNGELCTVRAPR